MDTNNTGKPTNHKPDNDKKDTIKALINDQYTTAPKCKKCGTGMVYAYGEIYECPKCGAKEYTDFGKVREYLEAHGPQNAVTIADSRISSVTLL